MARVTVEDCTKIINNRFKLVVLSSRRARDISSGAEIKVERDNDKDAVISLREIAEKKVGEEELLEEVISSYQSNTRYIAEEKEVDVEAKSSYEEEAAVVDDQESSESNMFQEDNIEVED